MPVSSGRRPPCGVPNGRSRVAVRFAPPKPSSRATRPPGGRLAIGRTGGA